VEEVSLTTPRPPYTISVRRTSAALGTVAELGPVSTNYLTAANRIAMEELLHRARFFDLPPRLPLEYVVPGDVFQEITVGNNEITRMVGYEREGSRHPAELDEVISLLERLAGWQQTHTSNSIPRGAVPATWTPTGSVPPLGNAAVRATENYPPAQPVGVGAPTGSGFYPGPTGQFPPAGSAYNTGPHTGPHTGGYPQQFASATPTGPSSTMPPAKSAGGAKKWIIIGLVAALVIAGGITAFLLTRPDPPPPTLAAPTGLAATADGRDVTVTWGNTSGATGYTLMRSGETVYTGVNTSFVDPQLLPGKYGYTVTASNAAGQTSASSAQVFVTITDPWGAAANLVAEFPNLLPATPSDKGYDDATCSVSSDTFNSKADAIVSCTDPKNVYFQVMHFASVEDKDAYIQRDYANSANVITWTRDDVDAGERYGSADDEAKLPYLLTSFTEEGREQYLIYVDWTDHTTQQLIDEWWKPADF
jgi:hypothetical protein